MVTTTRDKLSRDNEHKILFVLLASQCPNRASYFYMLGQDRTKPL